MMAERERPRRPTQRPPDLAAQPPAPAPPDGERLLRAYLRKDPKDRSLVAEVPMGLVLGERQRWLAFEAALKAWHAEQHPRMQLLRQQNRERTLIRYWVG